MGKHKRGQDLRKIKLIKCYTVQQCADLLLISLGTVRTWIRQGLPTVPDGKLILIPGDGLKAWLTQRRISRKQTCQQNEFYCCRCRVPRTAKAGSVVIIPRNTKTVTMRALCGTCDAQLNKAGALAKQSEIVAAFGLITPHQVHLAGCGNSAVNQHFERNDLDDPAQPQK